MKQLKRAIEIYKNGGYGNQRLPMFVLGFISAAIIVMVAFAPVKAENEKEAAKTQKMIACVHELEFETKVPTCQEDGYRKVFCTKCDYVESNSVFERLEHKIQYVQDGFKDEPYQACTECGHIFNIK